MFTIKIIDDIENFNNRVNSVMYVMLGDKAFPDDLWTDFPVEVLSMWSQNLIDCKIKQNDRFTLFFLDGPFYLNCHKEGDNIHISAINNRYIHEREECAINVSYAEIIHSVIEAIDCIHKIIIDNNYCDLELQELIHKREQLVKLSSY